MAAMGSSVRAGHGTREAPRHPERALELIFLPDKSVRAPMISTTNDSNFQVSTDRTRLDVPMIYRFLSESSTWAVGISRSVVEAAIENSLCFGGYLDGRQIAFARVVTDYATFANLVDVFVLPEYRGRGYAKQLIRVVMEHPSLQQLRRFTLNTADAHSLYARFGFAPPERPDTIMERYYPNIYLS
jgi:GNAT superfamily N-acetyltransferase